MTYAILFMNIFQDFNFSCQFEQGPNLILKKRKLMQEKHFISKNKLQLTHGYSSLQKPASINPPIYAPTDDLSWTPLLLLCTEHFKDSVEMSLFPGFFLYRHFSGDVFFQSSHVLKWHRWCSSSLSLQGVAGSRTPPWAATTNAD